MNSWIQWGFVAAFALAWPAYENNVRLPRVKAAILAGKAGRVREYRLTMLQEWALVAIALALVAMRGRSFAEIGLRLPQGGGIAWTVGIILGVIALLILQQRAATGSERARASVGRQLAPLRWFLPGPGAELANFRALSITAGVCEEILFRGYLMAALAPFGGTAVAVLVSSALFGLAHSYQGAGGAIRAGVLGGVMAGIYLVTGSLLAPILVHALVDLSSGQLAADVAG